jgi:type VI protein secretion system component Hcp
MTQRAIGAGAILIAFALIGLIASTYSIDPVNAAHIQPCTTSGLSMSIERVTDHVEIKKYSFAATVPQTNTGSGGQQSSSAPQFTNIIVEKATDENTPKILEKLARADIIREVHLQACYQLGKPNNFASFSIWLTNVKICSYQQDAENNNMPPTETLEFCYEKLMTMYTPPPDPEGDENNDEPTESEYDRVRNQGG